MFTSRKNAWYTGKPNARVQRILEKGCPDVPDGARTMVAGLLAFAAVGVAVTLLQLNWPVAGGLALAAGLLAAALYGIRVWRQPYRWQLLVALDDRRWRLLLSQAKGYDLAWFERTELRRYIVNRYLLTTAAAAAWLDDLDDQAAALTRRQLEADAGRTVQAFYDQHNAAAIRSALEECAAAASDWLGQPEKGELQRAYQHAASQLGITLTLTTN